MAMVRLVYNACVYSMISSAAVIDRKLMSFEGEFGKSF